jgi:tRNA (guanine26-N2/guanine27-N2)-dimethyltransferase
MEHNERFIREISRRAHMPKVSPSVSTVVEGKAKIVYNPGEKISKKMEVFYNPVMKHNRDISILLLNALGKKNMQIADPLAGSGIRSIRFLQELRKGCIEEISINDSSANAVQSIKRNLHVNAIPATSRVSVTCDDANFFMLKSQGFDYIDIDPFGSPNPFLDSAAKRLSRRGILAVTATDTSSLCGTHPKTCRRKYWATPDHSYLMHEMGLRILIRKVQLVAGQYEKALVPIYSYSKDHYMRCFFLCEKGRTRVDEIIAMHKSIGEVGPLWTGELWDEKLASRMLQMNNTRDSELEKFLASIAEEAKIHVIGFVDITEIAKKIKTGNIPQKSDFMKSVKKLKRKIAETHFRTQSFRTNATAAEILKILRK